MKTLIRSVAQLGKVMAAVLLAGCASNDSRPSLPPTHAALKQELLGHWYKPQAYVRGEARPPAGDEIEFRANRTCTYYITSGPYNPNLEPSPGRESWPGHWRLEGTKLYRTWAPNWHFFAGSGPGNGEIVSLTSKELTLRIDTSGAMEHYYRQPHWDEREPIMLDNSRREPWY